MNRPIDHCVLNRLSLYLSMKLLFSVNRNCCFSLCCGKYSRMLKTIAMNAKLIKIAGFTRFLFVFERNVLLQSECFSIFHQLQPQMFLHAP